MKASEARINETVYLVWENGQINVTPLKVKQIHSDHIIASAGQRIVKLYDGEFSNKLK